MWNRSWLTTNNIYKKNYSGFAVPKRSIMALNTSHMSPCSSKFKALWCLAIYTKDKMLLSFNAFSNAMKHPDIEDHDAKLHSFALYCFKSLWLIPKDFILTQISLEMTLTLNSPMNFSTSLKYSIKNVKSRNELQLRRNR